MKRLFYKMLFVVMGIGLIAPMFIIGPNGKPMMTFNDWMPNIDSIKGQVGTVTELGSSLIGAEDSQNQANGPGKNFYKWQDQNGVWQYSDKPNPSGQSQTVYVNPDANILSSAAFTGKLEDAKPTRKKSFAISMPKVGTASVADVPKLVEDVNNMQGLMDSREGTLDAQIDAMK